MPPVTWIVVNLSEGTPLKKGSCSGTRPASHLKAKDASHVIQGQEYLRGIDTLHEVQALNGSNGLPYHFFPGTSGTPHKTISPCRFTFQQYVFPDSFQGGLDILQEIAAPRQTTPLYSSRFILQTAEKQRQYKIDQLQCST